MRILLLAIVLALTATWATDTVGQTRPPSGQPIPAQQQTYRSSDHFTLDWILCFSDMGADVSARIKGCEVALSSQRLSANDVRKLTARRDFLRIERELEIDRYLDQKASVGGKSAAPSGGTAEFSHSSLLAKPPELPLEEPLNRHFLFPMTDYFLFLLVLIAIDALQRLWRRLTEATQGNASSEVPADLEQPSAATAASLVERPFWQPFKEIFQSNLNLSGWQATTQTRETNSNVFSQAEVIHGASPLGGGGSMQLRLRRSQRSGGLISSKVFFALDARAELSPEEKVLVSKYRLGKLVVYDSKARKKHQETAYGHFDEAAAGTSAGRGWWKNARGLASAAMMALSLRITVEGLMNGQHIECKDLSELLGAEAAILNACKNLRAYLDTAQAFDGREEVFEF
ncbi:hypothetical protein [Bradyrhizobium liaoningense]|uniref:hypothetical protein n=1 Tax=Bradyrhizobium liaoningense TaxID=43992 RepID=UPI0004B76E74|nr:hypothetical protein [Bradyrhizobium liaoningense]